MLLRRWDKDGGMSRSGIRKISLQQMRRIILHVTNILRKYVRIEWYFAFLDR
jgi:hypothetical protein